MCDTNPAEVAPMEAWRANAEWSDEVLALEPVDELSVPTVCEHAVDMPLPDQGPARRLSAKGGYRRLWMSVGLHLAWNFVEHPLLGFPDNVEHFRRQPVSPIDQLRPRPADGSGPGDGLLRCGRCAAS